MKGFHSLVRFLVLVGSLAGFFGGWTLLAHAQKPVAPEAAPANFAPQSLPPLNFNTTGSLQPLQPLQSLPRSSLPRLRTRGS